ncbi:hypothetical protein PAI11_05640 [Patulibacter medicamentivorans]|uniref:Uncharacterized protein n=1 Tax=Patulibacter medicamentivorans TaxID=1097667 RepID=H0E1A2_9ACTN|nr:hypothetical protein PAI11_05640 [Patulibacter medicamentivorans]
MEPQERALPWLGTRHRAFGLLYAGEPRRDGSEEPGGVLTGPPSHMDPRPDHRGNYGDARGARPLRPRAARRRRAARRAR